MNILLVDQEGSGKQDELIKELIDLRLLHQIKSRVTVSAYPGRIYRALLLDVSQYTGERARKGVEMIEFWRDSEKEKLRRAKLIFDSEVDFGDINESAKQKNKSSTNGSDDSKQIKFDL